MSAHTSAACSARGVGVRGACQLANIPIEDNEIVGQEGFKAADPRFNAPDAAFNFALQPPPHGAEPAHDYEGGDTFRPVYSVARADPDVSAQVRSAFPCLYSCQLNIGRYWPLLVADSVH